MPGLTSSSAMIALLAFTLGGVFVWLVTSRLRSFLKRTHREETSIQVIAERIRAVGKLVGLEVCAKEIATTTSGWAWLPPLLLSQARLAMIFNFEKQYTIDLSRVGHDDVSDLGEGRFRIILPPIEGHLRLLDLTPYDIQNARILGLLDVIPMTADRQRDMMKKAQNQAAELYQSNDERYLREARRSIERHLTSLLELFNIRAEVSWADQPKPAHAERPAFRIRRSVDALEFRESAEGRTRTADLRVMNPSL
jgi:hypothetical protein